MSGSAATRSVEYTLVELHCNLRHMRNVKDDLRSAVTLLEEQQRAGHNGRRNAAQLVLEGELASVEEVCRKLWETLSQPV